VQSLNIFNSNKIEGIGPRTREISARDRERLFFLMAMMLQCGQTTEASLRAVAKAFRSEGKEEVSAGLHAIAQKVAQGRPLNKAMELEYVMFDSIHRAAILAGEAANNMQKAFEILQYLEDRKISAARGGMAELLTPTVLWILSIVSLFNTGINTLPVMAEMKKAQGQPLSAIPAGIMTFTTTCKENWHFILAFFIILAIVIYSTLRTTQGRFWMDFYTLRIPILGKFITYKTYASMLLYFPHLISSGVKPKQMIPIMEALSTNSVLKRKIDVFNQVITTGGQMSEAMEKSGFPSIVVTPVTVSENYAGNEDGINDVMINGMNHAYDIINRELIDTHKRFIAIFSAIIWSFGGLTMLTEMMGIILSQT
jgi:type IV pilus assembly protein PilC